MERKAQPLPLDGATNVRDLGGYRAGDRLTKYHGFLRSNKLKDLTKEDQRFLLEYNLGCIIDLRSEMERRNEPDRIESLPVEYSHIPFRDFVYEAYSCNKDVCLINVYENILDQCSEQIKRVFKKMSEYEDQCVLFHCSAGKDRTGIISMLLLLLCDVEIEDILIDYEVTEGYLTKIVEEKKKEWKERGKVLPRYVYSSDRRDLKKTMEYLENKYTDSRTYLNQYCGISNNIIDTIQYKLI